MPDRLNRFPVFSLATRGLHASCWKAQTAPYRSTTLNASVSKDFYSSIANAMLRRADKAYEPSNTRNDLAKQLFPSSSPAQNGNIEDQFKKARQSSKSIGGYTSYTNPTAPLVVRSPNIKHTLKKELSISSTRPSTLASGLSSVLARQNSFQDTPDTIDLTREDEAPSKPQVSSFQGVQFNEDDFEDDADLDLDMEYELPMTMAAPPKPSLQQADPLPSPYTLPQLQRSLQQTNSSTMPSSSAPTWSSSSPSHKVIPPAALIRRKREELEARELGAPSEVIELNTRPAKRRTLFWLDKSTKEDNIEAITKKSEDEDLKSSTSSSGKICYRCRKTDHVMKDCPVGKSKDSTYAYTPLPKDKADPKMPWNNTGSAVAEERKKFKDKHKAAKKFDESALEAVENHYRSVNKAVIAPITLSEEQKRVLNLVVNQNKSVFFTGSAGTGKSVLMRAIIAELRKKYLREPDRVAVTASTGLAACNIGGVTLHSFGGIGLGKEDVPNLVKKIKRNQKAKSRWLRTKVLIIDEISMVDGDLFDKLEGIARSMRNNGRPFGGIQLVITGDFFQLPPVPDYDNKARDVKFAFDAGTWSTAIHHTIGLTEVFRQKDPVFANMLNEMRLGKITNETVAAFRKLNRKIRYEDSLDATELFPTRNEVENANAFRMRDLKGKSFKYEAQDSGTITDLVIREKLLANMMAPKTLELRKGAQVMLIKNMDDGLVNGSLGKVVAFMNQKTFEIYDNHPELFESDGAAGDLDDEVRARQANLKAAFAYKDGAGDGGKELPLVRFSGTDGTSRDLLILPEDWKVELPNGEVQAQRTQLPLILAWALSIHKAQGQTLERVKIDLKRVFEKGQAYVALSRATSQDGLEVHNFDKNKVMAHPRVAQFYSTLYSVNKALQHPKVAKAALKKTMKYEEEFLEAKREQAKEYGFDGKAAMSAYG